MKFLNGITALPTQRFTHRIDDKIVFFNLKFAPMVKMWFINVEFEGKIINTMRVCSSVNLLEQYSNVFKFGMAVFVEDGTEPYRLTDFSSKRVQLGILDESELELVSDYYQGLKNQ